MATHYKSHQLMLTVNNRGSFLKTLAGDAAIFHKGEQVEPVIPEQTNNQVALI